MCEKQQHNIPFKQGLRAMLYIHLLVLVMVLESEFLLSFVREVLPPVYDVTIFVV